jgi:hypothetical protein
MNDETESGDPQTSGRRSGRQDPASTDGETQRVSHRRAGTGARRSRRFNKRMPAGPAMARVNRTFLSQP